MKILLSLLSILLAFIGLTSLSQATLGVGCICAACLLAIFARIVQAHDHHQALLKKEDSEDSEY